ncbi:hypothetical protein PAMC26577_02250 [Caballeronia sordidicola]|uniref:Uncharacterized protein n=1 Tax=Caballeronia sordidicola TaxID=196367 RepID=A0A242N6J5_CABSO|nr:hypothetical protein PAMC26577_02250 [Caballeronia sordidicola]
MSAFLEAVWRGAYRLLDALVGKVFKRESCHRLRALMVKAVRRTCLSDAQIMGFFMRSRGASFLRTYPAT